MSTTPTVDLRRRHHSATAAVSRSSILTRSAAPALGLIALLVRGIGLLTANELFVDELTYARLAQVVSRGQLPSLAGQPFLLHPPGSFLLNGTVLAALHLGGDKMQLVADLRWVNAWLGATMVALAVAIVRRVAPLPVAVLAGLILSFDPFVLRNDTRVMLETPTTVAILAGLLVLITGLQRSASQRSWFLPAAGVLFGAAILCKDVAAVLTVVPVLAAVLWRRTLVAREAATLLGAAALPYSAYLVVLTVSGQFGLWWQAKTVGISRMLGLTQISGFHAPGTPSLAGQLAAQATRFGTSYLLIGLCAIAGLAAALLARIPAHRLVGLTALAAGLLGLYAAVGGALEEQYGYYVAVTGVLALATVVAQIIERRPRAMPWIAASALLFTILTMILGVQARATTDDGYVQARAWLDTHTSATTTRIGLTSVTAEFALLPDYRASGTWPSLTALLNNRAEYVLTQSRPLSEGYGYAAPALLEWLHTHATPVFTTTGPSGGDTVIWRLDPAQVAAAVAAGTTIPPVAVTHS